MKLTSYAIIYINYLHETNKIKMHKTDNKIKMHEANQIYSIT